jgi:hypothetical protein
MLAHRLFRSQAEFSPMIGYSMSASVREDLS